mmetsp:Transcript_10042/g.15192  ORF Transcript_10042/g.15192 Transcript_10042/m.15192 type:complete len:500 (-) Transcript_10042:145-1644(-)|eukprot:CAMPEP_0185032828 /NCGR_PEP_ID=MMETSP1103-20130426/21307_1 /TAXON_ID=36769 /ORGANISM="Paraphysomonas bandaiensis, Strain Caron Lab Isolate" /LENGTH=499 /DNA_ID=CAMNT_0027568879 /DNA_START=95 /DNA_END=1594 /DNA_ORIENTATION=-
MTKTTLCIAVVVIAFGVAWISLLISLLGDVKGHSLVSFDNKLSFRGSSVTESTLDVSRGLQRIKPAGKHRFDEPPSLDEIRHNITVYLTTLHRRLGALAGPKVEAPEIWEEFLDVTKNTLIKWDDENRNRFPTPREDGTIFVSLGTYRDPYCPMTIKSLFSKAKYPEKLYVSLFQQNCFEKKCRTGVLQGGKVEDADTDVNCYDEFCKSPEGQQSDACNNGHVRLFNVNESESLGPYMARYLGAKFYRGEQYYLQIDSHSEFIQDWDFHLISMMNAAPAEKPVISTYPPDSAMKWQGTPGFRMCDSDFATSQIEWEIIRLSPSRAYERRARDEPAYAPFVAAGFFFSGAEFLYEAPFDPLLPWIFMGEEISMSARLWTAGYDIFAPTINVLNHYYVRRHYPKFWESVNRYFKKPIHNEIIELVIKRVKCMLGYGESTAKMVSPHSLLYRLEDWSMGKKRSFKSYMDMVGIDPVNKKVTPNRWCHNGLWPPQAEKYKIKK